MKKRAECIGERVPRPYCLRCYLHLAPFEDAQQECSRCGYLNLRLDQSLYWTRERRFRELEAMAKTSIIVLLVWVSHMMVTRQQMSFGTGQGWAVGFPILIGAVLWETASKITRWKPYFRATIVWTVISGVVVLPAWVVTLAAFVNPISSGLRLAVLGLAVTSTAGVLFTRRIGREFSRWRVRRILTRGAAGSDQFG